MSKDKDENCSNTPPFKIARILKQFIRLIKHFLNYLSHGPVMSPSVSNPARA
jgi:hypothetical protein